MKYVFLIFLVVNCLAQEIIDFVPQKSDNIFDLKSIYRGEEFIPNLVAQTIFDEKELIGHENYTIYLEEIEKNQYKIEIKAGRVYQNGKLYSTNMNRNRAHSIFILDTDGTIYISDINEMNKFHHSSFNGGNSVYAAGEVYIKDGYIIAMNNRSGHYPVDDNSLNTFRRRLKDYGLESAESIRSFNFNDHSIDGHQYRIPQKIHSPCEVPFISLFQ